MQEGTSDPRFPKHFDGKRFHNPDAAQAPGLLEALRWKLTSRPESSPRCIPDVEQSTPPRRVEGSGLRTTLVNHSTVLLQQRGSNILTDPIWSERASPLSLIGPRRRRKPGVSWKDLPCIDAVLISHNHYDHLDLPTLRGLTARGDCIFVVPARVARLLRSENIGPAHELDWGESLSLRIHHSLSPGAAFLEPGNFRPKQDPLVRVCDRMSGPACILRGRHRVRTSFRPDSGKVRIAAPRVIADRSVRATLVHVAGAHGSR